MDGPWMRLCERWVWWKLKIHDGDEGCSVIDIDGWFAGWKKKQLYLLWSFSTPGFGSWGNDVGSAENRHRA